MFYGRAVETQCWPLQPCGTSAPAARHCLSLGTGFPQLPAVRAAWGSTLLWSRKQLRRYDCALGHTHGTMRASKHPAGPQWALRLGGGGTTDLRPLRQSFKLRRSPLLPAFRNKPRHIQAAACTDTPRRGSHVRARLGLHRCPRRD